MEQTNPQHKAENDVITSFHFFFYFLGYALLIPQHHTSCTKAAWVLYYWNRIFLVLLFLLFGFWRALLLLVLLVICIWVHELSVKKINMLWSQGDLTIANEQMKGKWCKIISMCRFTTHDFFLVICCSFLFLPFHPLYSLSLCDLPSMIEEKFFFSLYLSYKNKAHTNAHQIFS